MSEIPGYLTVAEAAAILGVDPSQVRRYCLGASQRKLPAKKVGSAWLIQRKDLDKFEKPQVGNPNLKKS